MFLIAIAFSACYSPNVLIPGAGCFRFTTWTMEYSGTASTCTTGLGGVVAEFADLAQFELVRQFLVSTAASDDNCKCFFISDRHPELEVVNNLVLAITVTFSYCLVEFSELDVMIVF